MRVDIDYNTKKGLALPISVWVKPVKRDLVLEFQTTSKKERNSWCLQGSKPCFLHGCKPCCPPTVKLFSQLPEHKTLYLVMVGITFDDYCEYSPKTLALGKRADFCFMSVSHKLSATTQNAISSSFEGQAFRVWGCLGCKYMKDGKCKRFMPPLEATGINVIDMAKQFFDFDIQWHTPQNPIRHMVSVGGIYTDEIITPKKFKEVIRNVTNN